MFELVELASKAFKKTLTPFNIKDRFRRTDKWKFYVDSLMCDIGCSQTFDMEGQEEEDLQDHVDAQEDVDG